MDVIMDRMETLPPLSQLIPTPKRGASCQALVESGFVVKRGFLHKKRSDRKRRLFGSVLGTKWKFRYVVVVKGCVYMFKNESSIHSQRAMSLFGFTEVNVDNSNKAERFKFIVKDALEDRDWERTLTFYTNSEADRAEWIDCFKSEILEANINLYHSFSNLSIPRSSSSPSVFGSSPIHISESSASLGTIMGSMSAIHLKKIQDSLRKTESPSSDEDDDYTEIIEDDPEESNGNSKEFSSIRNRPRLPIPSELTREDLEQQKKMTATQKQNPSSPSKSRTLSCPSPCLRSYDEFQLPPDCSEFKFPRSVGSQGELGPSPPPSRFSPVLPVGPKPRKPLLPVKPQKPDACPPPLPKTVNAENLLLPPKIVVRGGNMNTRKKPLPPLPTIKNPNKEDSWADERESGASPVSFSKEVDIDDEFLSSPLVKASYWSQDKDEAEKIMTEIEEDGVFMIRKGTDDQDFKTLIVRCGPKIRKYKIVREEGELYSLHLGKSGFGNVTELLEFYFNNPVPNQSIKLTKPFTEVWTQT